LAVASTLVAPMEQRASLLDSIPGFSLLSSDSSFAGGKVLDAPTQLE
jgi:hypothetical protein